MKVEEHVAPRAPALGLPRVLSCESDEEARGRVENLKTFQKRAQYEKTDRAKTFGRYGL
jgi:hypothetical protein